MSVDGAESTNEPIRQVERAVQMIFSDGKGLITPAVETELQKAIHSLRSARTDERVLEQAEEIAKQVAVISLAQRNGMPNLYASKMLRLKRLVLGASAGHA